MFLARVARFQHRAPALLQGDDSSEVTVPGRNIWRRFLEQVMNSCGSHVEPQWVGANSDFTAL